MFYLSTLYLCHRDCKSSSTWPETKKKVQLTFLVFKLSFKIKLCVYQPTDKTLFSFSPFPSSPPPLLVRIHVPQMALNSQCKDDPELDCSASTLGVRITDMYRSVSLCAPGAQTQDFLCARQGMLPSQLHPSHYCSY